MRIFDWFGKHHAKQKRAEEPLVDPEKIEKFIDGREDLKPYGDFIKTRWLSMVVWWHNRSVEARRKYFFLRRVVVAGGVFIPVLSALDMNSMFAPYAPIAIAVVGAVVAGCAAWEGVANYGEIWREKRRAAELLKVEGWQFFQLCGKYQDNRKDENNLKYAKAFPRFAAEVENMIAKEVGEYLAVFGPSLDQAKAVAEKALLDIVEDVRKKLGHNTNTADKKPVGKSKKGKERNLEK